VFAVENVLLLKESIPDGQLSDPLLYGKYSLAAPTKTTGRKKKAELAFR
jgi:hypothetical protein